MDTLTHGLLGAALAALPLPLPRGLAGDTSPRSTRAAILVCILAAELPDLDYLVPAQDAVLHTLKAHRGVTHSLLAAPAIALVATSLVKLFYRDVRFLPLYLRALLAVPLAHLLPDLWTGWGTRLFLPFSEDRAALDWTMVIDPYFTLPLLIGAGLALAKRRYWRRMISIGLGVAIFYLGVRVVSSAYLTSVVRRAHPGAHVFPAPLAVFRWRYVAELGDEYSAGAITIGAEPEEQARVPRIVITKVPAELASVPAVREALAWARFPVWRIDILPEGVRRIEVADLRYHLRGEPTLKFIVAVAADGTVTEARLDRGGSVRDLVERWRQ